ncbi:50S ribosomal protein L10 [Kytococcus sedentarius]|uniref:Large ribosomal subunit protein uL10 n=2 Tax=Kytococcus TaxID=57499 RepID=A0A212TA00_9MICO|nr:MULTISPECIES: 50S ribosomal protein L10 [Kytococcus]ACV07092.1 LSU ribosomal protein L10P [Kytococcus sedentarius DSM 20547]QQB63080.1 50S ribosomal protein L10 [Kytococcus sedentarius]SNC62868.1 LSU ribosomal protein L10P [Kytococcus aerolatus]STX14080.1 50S ribosomal protein L10 [Kytococcus sedentarius]
MANPQKDAVIAEIASQLRDSNAAVLTEYRGLTVAQMAELRKALRGNATYSVVKNTLTARAAAEAGVDAFDGYLSGPTAIAFVTGDAVEVAKGLRDFAKENEALVIKAGLVDGQAYTADDLTKLASLESREVLLAKLAGAMKAPMANTAALLNGAPAQMARLAEALRAKVETEGPVSGAPADSAEAPAADEQTDTDVAEGGDDN